MLLKPNSGWLKAATLAAGVPKVTIIGRLRAAMQGHEPARDYKVVHASDVTKASFCARRWMFMSLFNGKPEGSWVGTALRATYDLGHSTARVLIEEWAKDFAIGNWDCLKCGASRTMSLQPKSGCGKSSSCHWRFREPVFESKEYGIEGSIDVLMDLLSLNWVVVELKTYAAEEFDKMITALPEHVTRTRLYLKLIADSGSPWTSRINLNRAHILYASRGYGRKNPDFNNEILPFREFVVDRNDDHPDVQLALQKGKFVKLFKDIKQIPGGICATPLDKNAQGCAYCQQCFSGKYQAGKILS